MDLGWPINYATGRLNWLWKEGDGAKDGKEGALLPMVVGGVMQTMHWGWHRVGESRGLNGLKEWEYRDEK